MIPKQNKKRVIRRTVSDVSGGNSVWRNMTSVVMNLKNGYYQSVSKDNTVQDFINLKSPTSPNVPESKLPSDESFRRKSVEVADLNRMERGNTITSNDRFSTCLTPTATSFSRDELNEIFNVGRTDSDTMMKTEPTDYSFDAQSSMHDNSLLNTALNQSNISIDSIECTTPIKKSSVTELKSSPVPSEQSLQRNALQHLDLQEISTFRAETPKLIDNGLMNPRLPFTPSPDGRTSFSPIQMVCREIFMTEKSYVKDLQEIIEGYIYHLKQQKELDVESLFGNLENIYEFNKDVLYALEQCETDDYEIDPVKLATVFVEKARGFNHHYVQYCTNYPEASSCFSFIMRDPDTAKFFQERQKIIGHALSLESYLLKPVQRIMKYHLLFRDILKRYEGDKEGYNTINTAVSAMTDVAEYINEMKRLHENAVKVQQILSGVIDLDVPIDIFETGRLVLENTFKVQGARGDRKLYLFEKLLLICKKNEDKYDQFKEKVECSNMMLVESLPKDPLAFQILRFDNQKVNYTIMAKTLEIKKTWAQHLKRLILENHKSMIPQTARQAILGPEEKAKSKYNSLPMNALDDSVMGNIRNLTKASTTKPNHGKENVAMPAGVKRESNESESSNSPKRSLNMKARYYLEKKSRSNLLSNSLTTVQQPSQQQPSPEKDKKRWKKNKHKRKPSSESEIVLEGADETPDNLVLTSNSRAKSRSLESLKDNIRLHENNSSVDKRSILQEIINHNFEAENNNHNPRPMSMTELDDYSKETNNPERQTSTANIHIGRKSRKVSKSMSLNMPTHREDASYDTKRWSKLSDVDPMELLERRLSILNDDDVSAMSIKNMVRKVSNAFNSSYQAYDESGKNSDRSETRDLDAILGSRESSPKPSHRRSTGDVSSSSKTSSVLIGRSRSEMFLHKRSVEVKDTVVKSKLPVGLHTSVTSLEPDENRWLADVDQVFDEVNADIISIADSLSSEANKSNESDTNTLSDNNEQQNTSIVDINTRADLVNARLREANDLQNMSPNSARKINVEVKRVADRIKEYKKLIDAEKQRNSWKRHEPRTMNEMIETLDSISTVNNGLSPVYASHRRRFKSSRDMESFERKMSDDNSKVSTSVVRSFSENYDTEKPIELPKEPEVTVPTNSLRSNLTSASDDRLSDSSSSISSIDMKAIKETQSIAKRTERYKEALKTFEHRKSLTKSLTDTVTSDDITHKENESDVYHDHIDNQLDNAEFRSKSLPNPRRSNAIKRNTRQTSEELDTKDHNEKPNFQKSISLEMKPVNRSLERTKPKSSRWVNPISRKSNRSSSVPPEKRHSVGVTVSIIHEEVPRNTYLNARLATRALSDSSGSSPDVQQSRGRTDIVKHSRNSGDRKSSKYFSMPRSKKKDLDISSQPNNLQTTSNYHRSTSLPRRSHNVVKNPQLEAVQKDIDDNHNHILRSPSIRCIQQNHVNARIKEYFTNLQKSSQVSTSRPNLLLVGSCSESESEENDSSSTSIEFDGSISPTGNTDHILRGTVRSMIKRYGQSNYVFDEF